MVRFLHIGDIHLDSTFYSKDPDLRSALRSGIRESFDRAINYCIQNAVNALLIAGDMFDNDTLSFATESFLLKGFKRLNDHNIDVFYTTGNHDPGLDIMKNKRIEFTENVHIFWDDNVKTIDKIYNGIKCRIVGVGHIEKGENRNLIKEFPIGDKDIIHIGIAHTMVGSVQKNSQLHESYLPTTLEDLKDKQYDYWALGHIHKREYLNRERTIAYSGNIQGRSFKETGVKGGILIDIEDKVVTTEFQPFSVINWHEHVVSNTEISTYKELTKYLIKEIQEFIKVNRIDGKSALIRLNYVGRTNLYKELMDSSNVDLLAEEVRDNVDVMDLEIRVKDIQPIRTGIEKLDNSPYIEYMKTLIDDLEKDTLENLLNNIDLLSLDIINDEDKRRYISDTIRSNKQEILSMFVEVEI